MINDYSKADSASWKEHSAEFLRALHALVEAQQKQAEALEAIANNLAELTTEIWRSRRDQAK